MKYSVCGRCHVSHEGHRCPRKDPPSSSLVDEMANLLRRYRYETPLGHQPHMIAHKADELLSRYSAGER